MKIRDVNEVPFETGKCHFFKVHGVFVAAERTDSYPKFYIVSRDEVARAVGSLIVDALPSVG